MDEKYEDFLSLQPLLHEVAALRRNKCFKKMLNETYRAEMENLRNVEIELYTSTPKLADPSKWPCIRDVPVPLVDVKQPLEEYSQILCALDCLKQT